MDVDATCNSWPSYDDSGVDGSRVEISFTYTTGSRRRYQHSDPLGHNHHSDMEDDEPEREPRVDMAQRIQTYNSRIFLMFTMIVDQKPGRWGRRHQPQFEWEAESWTTDEGYGTLFG